MFLPLLWPSTGRCISKDMLQNFFNQSTNVGGLLCVKDTLKRLCAFVGFIAISNHLKAWSWIVQN